MANDGRDYCLWNPNIKHKKQGLLLPRRASPQDLRGYLEKEKEEDSSAEDCIRDSQSPELVATAGCSSLRPPFRKCFKLWKKRSIKNLTSLQPCCVPNMTESKNISIAESPVLCNLYNFRSSLVNFSLSDLRNATHNFSRGNLIGRGGYAEVFKGCLRDGQLIAVKRLIRGTLEEITSTFLSELGIIAHVNHHNTAKLIGCGVEGGMHLVFELSPLGSLESLIHGSSSTRQKLDWSKRYRIITGIADGLLYLHESCPRRIIHRDIKAENILLTENFEPQICDFGLAKWLPDQCTHHNISKFEGTFGYFAPEYLMHGIVDEKTDVYSFGVLLLEIITGRRALDDLNQSLVLWAKPLLDANDIEYLADPALGGDYDRQQMNRVVLTASLCVERSPILRPLMSQVAVLLRGDDYVLETPRASQRRTLRRAFAMEQGYNSPNNFSYQNRHKQVALGS
ncbi:receptor-like cytosolic serine/threonine-protein kinase RBK2 [Lotus japonicus]|uniref:receptor-like cytosolic serine/threonine-protein kinase RBK2 n=1 Tax=Lotus japonicus TaxID=34305 RepID=UPI0025826E6B|nr:receptor-like cytosolic serine/threonine-protein kinase RBK2 [Lotus japonicus]